MHSFLLKNRLHVISKTVSVLSAYNVEMDEMWQRC